jgi:hypothetical protein
MSFRIQHSHKFASQFPEPKESKARDSLLDKDDYLLFDLDKSVPSHRNSQKVKVHKGGNFIHPVSSAQADFY